MRIVKLTITVIMLLGLVGAALAQSLTSFTISPSTVVGGQNATGKVTLSGNAPAGGAMISVSSPDPIVEPPSTVTVAAGTSSKSFTIKTYPINDATTYVISALYCGVCKTASITLLPEPCTLANFTITPSSVVGGQSATGKVTLTGNAPAGGTVVSISSPDPIVEPPATVTVAAGTSSKSFTIKTYPINDATTYTITAAIGNCCKTACITLLPDPCKLVGLSVSPNPVIGGQDAIGTVTLSANAPAGGTTVMLSDSSNFASVPASVLVPAGQKTASFLITTVEVAADTNVNITARCGEVCLTFCLTVKKCPLKSVTVSPNPILGGTKGTGTVTLFSPAPSGGLQIHLSDDSPYVSVPSSVMVAAGTTSKSFTVNTTNPPNQVGVTITARCGTVCVTFCLIVKPCPLKSVTINPDNVFGGQNSTGTVWLHSPAPSGGLVVNLSSSSFMVTVPSAVLVPAGATSKSFTIKTNPISHATTYVITASVGNCCATACITLWPCVQLCNFCIVPNCVKGGQNATGTVSIQNPAPEGGIMVRLSSPDPIVQVPAFVIIPQGATQVSFTLKTFPIAHTTTYKISATAGPNTLFANITLTP